MGWNHHRKNVRGGLVWLTVAGLTGLLVLAGCSGSSSDSRTQAKASQSGEFQIYAQIATPRNGDFILFHADGTTDVTFEATATGGTEPLNYNWSITGPNFQNTSSGETGVITFYTPGVYTFLLTVVDVRGFKGTDTIRVTVGYAQDQQLIGAGLQAVIASPAADVTVRLGESISYTSSVIGGSGTYGYRWQFPGGDVLSAAAANPPAVTYNTLGTFTTTLTVTDSFGNTATDTVRVTVVSFSQAPGMTVLITVPSGSAVAAGTALNLAYNVIGGSGGATTQTWTVTSPDGTVFRSNLVAPNYPFTPSGNHVIRLSVLDNSTGETATAIRTVQALP
jgi:hypothetical protein